MERNCSLNLEDHTDLVEGVQRRDEKKILYVVENQLGEKRNRLKGFRRETNGRKPDNSSSRGGGEHSSRTGVWRRSARLRGSRKGELLRRM